MRRASWITTLVAAVLMMVSAAAIAANFTMILSSDGNGNALSDGDRETRVALAIQSQGLSVQPGDTIEATFSDGWKQSFTVEGTSNMITVKAVPGTLKQPTINAGGGGGPTGCGGSPGYWQPVYGYAEVCVNGECSGSWYVERYEWIPGQEVSNSC